MKNSTAFTKHAGALMLFFLYALSSHGQNITKLEYFIDTDPGYGSATNVVITPASSIQNFTFSVPLTSVSDGFHTLFIRGQDANGGWSIVQNRPFLKLSTSTSALPDITKVEYFIDTDPGYGNATNVTITPSAAVTDLNFSINVSALLQGTHKLFVRSKDANYKWSLVYTNDFEVCSGSPTTAQAATSITTNGFIASWSAVSGATYKLDVSADNFATFVSGYNDLAVTATSQTIIGLTIGTIYKYRVRAVGTCTSISSNLITVTTLLPTPVASAGAIVTESGFTASWAPVTSATGYQLDVSTDNFVTFIPGYNSKSTTATSEVLTGLAANTVYQYRIRAVNTGTGATSANSSTISVTTVMAAPLAVAATSILATGFTANWNASSGATNYELDISVDNFASFAVGYNARAITGTTAAVTGLSANTDYKYRVRAVNGTSRSVNSNSIDVTTAAKQDQTITFAAIADKTLGDAAFSLSATASSSLAVTYATTSDKITISGSNVTLVQPGRALVTASQSGNESFNSATSVDQSFCIKPPKPTITLSGVNTESITLTSSSAIGNQWFLNGTAISNAVNATLVVTQPGVYKVQITADDCSSAFSDSSTIIVTGEISDPSQSIELYPNPVHNYVQITGIKEINESMINDSMGRTFPIELKKEGDLYHGDVHSLASGLYVLQVRQGNSWYQIKLVKD